MLTIEKKKKYTVDDYMLLEEGAPFQSINNELVMSPSPNSFHQQLIIRIGHIILSFLESRKLGGYTATSMDVVFDENNVFQPDFLYVSKERKAQIVKDRVEGAAKQAKGKIKETVGKVTGDAKTEAEGKADKAEGKVQNTVGGIKDKAREVLDDK